MWHIYSYKQDFHSASVNIMMQPAQREASVSVLVKEVTRHGCKGQLEYELSTVESL